MIGLFLIDRGRAIKVERTSISRSFSQTSRRTGSGPGKSSPPRSEKTPGGEGVWRNDFRGASPIGKIASSLQAPKRRLSARQGHFQGRKSLPGAQDSRKYAIDTGMGTNIISQYRFGF